jgi:hypothetical protein
MLRAGIATAPVLMTLASRPVLGSVQCTTCSAYGSINASTAGTAPTACAGKTPTMWTASTTSWPTPYYPTTKHGTNGYDATLYHCTTTGLGGTTFASTTLYNVMCLADDGGVHSLGRYIGAALLNARLGLTPVLTEALVRRLWNDYVALGYFEPTAGVQWGPAQIVAYIKSTMG